MILGKKVTVMKIIETVKERIMEIKTIKIMVFNELIMRMETTVLNI